MKKYVIGNWKCNKGGDEAQKWLAEFARRYRPVAGLQIIIAPSFICLQSLAHSMKTLGLENFSLAAQVSHLSPGAPIPGRWRPIWSRIWWTM